MAAGTMQIDDYEPCHSNCYHTSKDDKALQNRQAAERVMSHNPYFHYFPLNRASP